MERIKYLFGLQNLTKVIPNNDSNSKIEVLEKKNSLQIMKYKIQLK